MVIDIKSSQQVKKNSLKAIIKGSRIETLPGAAVPVIIGIALAAGDMYRTANILNFNLVPAILCFLFACIMQINANLINDYFDYRNGHDSNARMGNDRVATKGWMTMPFMRGVIAGTNLLAAITGLPLLFYGDWRILISIGIFCMIFSLLYTTFFSKRALGDILVLIFFGIVPVCTTYYLLTGNCNWYIFMASVACGFEIDSMLVINNFRDHDEDLTTGKHTLSHILGRRNMLLYYLIIGFICTALGYFCFYRYGYTMAFHLQIIYLINHINRYNTMRNIWQGPKLNKELAKNGKNILLYGVLIAVGIILKFV
ncbi:MAG: 1,4-dihydroxy-2-naphthoate octaprenyltransferase [Bacteroidaceae bacterium]|nr:1,4-dihydroxy-2-naphthoate octaprenyltransferase [Bacteroidaceae bacterium]